MRPFFVQFLYLPNFYLLYSVIYSYLILRRWLWYCCELYPSFDFMLTEVVSQTKIEHKMKHKIGHICCVNETSITIRLSHHRQYLEIVIKFHISGTKRGGAAEPNFHSWLELPHMGSRSTDILIQIIKQISNFKRCETKRNIRKQITFSCNTQWCVE